MLVPIILSAFLLTIVCKNHFQSHAIEFESIEPSISIPLKDRMQKNASHPAADSVFHRIRPFVYPAMYRMPERQQQQQSIPMDMRNHRNITPPIIQANVTEDILGTPTYTAELQANTPPNARSDIVMPIDDAHPKYGAFDVDIYHQQPPASPQFIDYGHRHAYTLATTTTQALPAALTPITNVGVVGGLLNPVLLMTLWLVVFLVNSLMNLVDGLNLTKAAANRMKMDKMDKMEHSYGSGNNDDQRHYMNEMIMNSLEKMLRMTSDLYDNNSNSLNRLH